MSFHTQSFAARHNTMGDISEGVFDQVTEGRAHPLGLNRFWMNGDRLYMNKMTPAMRYAPDRMTAEGFVECMGVGRDQILKLKKEKLDALLEWAELGPVDLFVYDSHKVRWWQAPVGTWWAQCAEHATEGTFPEGKKFYALKTEHFPGEPHEL